MWKPNTSPELLLKRARYLQQIRHFFATRNVTEVDVPVLGMHTVTDPFVDALSMQNNQQTLYLQTSPEYFMKRMLAAGVGDIYYMGKAFRADEVARLHNIEFTMLEWYRIDYDDQRLIQELIELVKMLAPDVDVTHISYERAFRDYLNVNPHTADNEELDQLVRHNIDTSFTTNDRSTLLDLLFSTCVESKLPMGLVVINDYPECQSALARVEKASSGANVARRFEVFLDRIELANGYWELNDFIEQKRRFDDDNQRREKHGKDIIQPDPFLLEAIEAGLPNCSGVALGVDRLMMKLLSVDSISSQRAF